MLWPPLTNNVVERLSSAQCCMHLSPAPNSPPSLPPSLPPTAPILTARHTPREWFRSVLRCQWHLFAAIRRTGGRLPVREVPGHAPEQVRGEEGMWVPCASSQIINCFFPFTLSSHPFTSLPVFPGLRLTRAPRASTARSLWHAEAGPGSRACCRSGGRGEGQGTQGWGVPWRVEAGPGFCACWRSGGGASWSTESGAGSRACCGSGGWRTGIVGEQVKGEDSGY